MKVPLSWLRDYVDVDVMPETLVEKLTFSGIEVEGVHTIGAGLDAVVVGRVIDVQPHPNADKLRVCRVSDGQAEHAVVCGAWNFEAGAHAAFAPAGVTLPDGTTIEKRRLRGVESAGMLCSERELGLSDDQAGIMVFGADTAPGTPLSTLLGLPDVVLDLEITWNRPDCLSIIGIAREVAALLNKPVRLPDVTYLETGADIDKFVAVTIEAPAACPRYTARALSNAAPGPAPAWMRHRLFRCGVRPISNLVDVTNYVMLECGQPLHAFDHSLLGDGRIVVRHAAEGETMHTLDDAERRLDTRMLVIADARVPVAIAGVMGGAGSEIRDETRDVLLESASFEPAGVHRTSTVLGLSTESSHRFERGVDPELADWASRRAMGLMLACAGGSAARGVVDCYPGKREPATVRCRFRRVHALLGIPIAAAEVVRIFESLDLTVVGRDADGCEVQPPSFRRDLEIEADLIEEVARIHGLDQIPEARPSGHFSTDVDDRHAWSLSECRNRLIGLGLREVMHYSFISGRVLDQIAGDDPGRRVALPNPVSADHGYLRPMLLPPLMGTLGHNMSRQVADAAFFEIGRVFDRRDGGQIDEQERLAIGLMGGIGRHGIAGRRPVEPGEMFLWTKGVIESLAAAVGVAPPAFEPSAHGMLDADWSVAVRMGGGIVGHLGLAREALRSEWRISGPVGLAELELAPFLGTDAPVPQFVAIPVFPSILRDLAVIVDESMAHADVVTAIRGAGPRELTDVYLFDTFRGVAVGEGKKSLAYALRYRSAEGTLTDEDANRFDEAIREALRRQLNAEIREG